MSSPYQSSVLSPIPLMGSGIVPAVLVHEDPAEAIQGGAPGEHYHIDAAQHAELLDMIVVGLPIYEPCMTSLGELIVAASGDCLVAHGGFYAS